MPPEKAFILFASASQTPSLSGEANPAHLESGQSQDIHGALDFVRLRPEFQIRKEDTFWQELMNEPWVKDIKKQVNDILDAIGDLMKNAFSGVKFPEIKPEAPWFDQVFAYAVYTILVILALFLFYLLLSFIKNSMGRQKSVVVVSQNQGKAVSLQSSQYYLQKAQKAREANQWDEASRMYYWAGLSLLNEKSYLSLKANRTNREYLIQLKNTQKQYAVSPFQSLIKPFEKSFYGGLPITQHEAEASLQAWESLIGELNAKKTTQGNPKPSTMIDSSGGL